MSSKYAQLRKIFVNKTYAPKQLSVLGGANQRVDKIRLWLTWVLVSYFYKKQNAR